MTSVVRRSLKCDDLPPSHTATGPAASIALTMFYLHCTIVIVLKGWFILLLLERSPLTITLQDVFFFYLRIASSNAAIRREATINIVFLAMVMLGCWVTLEITRCISIFCNRMYVLSTNGRALPLTSRVYCFTGCRRYGYEIIYRNSDLW